jgi:hypothetical protein
VAQGLLQCHFVVELHDAGGAVWLYGWAHVAGSCDDAAFAQDGERLVHGAVVAPVEYQDAGTAGDLARHPDREPVRVGGGERNLPQWQAEPFGQGFAYGGGVGGWHHGGDGAG